MSAADRFAAADAAAAQQEEEEEVLDATDLYDSERLAINKVTTALLENVHKHRELGSFQREVRERFAEIGFVARCDFYESRHEDHLPKSERTQYPEITLLRRCEPTGEFDHERMGHEVRSNILGEKGRDSVQKTQIGQTGFGGEKRTSSGLILPN